ncbi:MAG: glycoside hydrolase [Bacteroidota bacterium]|nr:glycoside hydrolase [Bacteroidota bacterium]
MKKNYPALAAMLFFSVSILQAQSFDPSLFNSMQWRMIGPHRGGRTVGAVGVPQQPNVFYIGVNNGGVWKTTDYGRTWWPIFDDQPTGSIGDIAVAPSNPAVIYVGSGEGLQRPDLSVGDGIYKSTDGGKTWTNTGLNDAQQIGGLAIDPTNENRVFVAALGHPYGPNAERGVYRTTDGGHTWEKVLYKDENTGASQVAIDPKNPNIVYADLWAGRQGPWENGAWNGPESGLFKSTDGGTTWKKLTNGLPTTQQGLGRIGFAIAPSDPSRIYATVESPRLGGIYSSNDAGETWKLLTNDNRYFGRSSDFAEIKVDPKNADILYTANVVTWKSVDGGKTWDAFRGAPGGDDYHRIWINPNNPEIILIASDQGAIITVNGGETFSSWYNQPTAQFYHVSTDNAFPYNVYGGQQESGSVGIASRGNDGEITFREWHPVAAEEYGYVAADPLNSNIIYGGKITRFDKQTGQVQNISPEVGRGGKYRFLRTAPVLFSPVDKKTLYFAGNVLFKTTNGGNNWQVISPDLTRESWDIPQSVGIYLSNEVKTMQRRGVIYTVAPSYKDINTIWCGTDDGLIQLTKDGGKTWKNVTPPEIASWSKISMMDAGHFDVNTAYAAVNRIRVDDMRPHIYRTTDAGKTWKEIVNGLPDDPINVVREDPQQKGLLFAGSERSVYVSFDDGGHWQSLRLNMPATSIRDLVIKDDDIVVGTHGRSFWILDDITPLRQLAHATNTQSTILYKPQTAIRVRWDMWTDTPLPQEEPAGQNPPDGAIIDYYLKEKAQGEVTLEILDAKGMLIRTYSSHDTVYKIPPVNIPLYWIRPVQLLSAEAGSHRFMWDLKYTPLDVPPSYPIAAIYKNTAPAATAPWVMPGTYTVKLTVDGKSFTQSLTVKMDPRVKTSLTDLQKQHDLSLQCYQMRNACMAMSKDVHAFRSRLQSRLANADTQAAEKINQLEKQAAALEGAPGPGFGGGGAAQAQQTPGFGRLNGSFAALFSVLEESDRAPTSQAVAAFDELKKQFLQLATKWAELKSKQ